MTDVTGETRNNGELEAASSSIPSPSKSNI
jgi:hypothetical protein